MIVSRIANHIVNGPIVKIVENSVKNIRNDEVSFPVIMLPEELFNVPQRGLVEPDR